MVGFPDRAPAPETDAPDASSLDGEPGLDAPAERHDVAGDTSADAGVDAADAAPDVVSDARVDTPPDAPADALPDAPLRCSTLGYTPTFCDDFDEHAAATYDWDTPARLSAGSTVVLDGAGAISPPSAMLATVPVGATGFASLVRTVTPQPKSRFHLRFWVRIDAIEAADGALFELALGGTALRCIVAADHAKLEEEWSGSTTPHPMPIYPEKGAWSYVDVLLTLGPPVHVTLRLGPSPGALATAVDDDLTHLAAGATTLDLGIVYATTPTVPWQLRFDDVRYDVDGP